MSDENRNFVLRVQTEDGVEEDGVYKGKTPRQAALKAARRQTTARDSLDAAQEDSTVIRLRERGTDKVHEYDAWSWTEDAPEDAPDWLPETVTEANVSKNGIEHLDD